MTGIAGRRRAARQESKEQYTARRQALIEVAATVFREKGYEATTLNDIAERFGTERASLYYYVSSKEELFQEAVRGMLDVNVEAAERIYRRRCNAETKLALLIEQVITSYEAHYPYIFLYIQEGMPRVGAGGTAWAHEMTRQTRRIEAITIKLIEQGIREGSFREDVRPLLASNALWGMLNWTHRWYKPGRDIGGPEMIEGFSTIFLQGLRKTHCSRGETRPEK